MGIRGECEDFDTASRVGQLLPRFLDEISCRACWLEVPVSISDNVIDMELIKVRSNALAVNLRDCDRAILFAATIGIEADRLCRAAAVYTPSNALIYDAMGSAAIEWFCDTLCKTLACATPEYNLRPRFSPGYGDLPLELQADLLRVLDAQHKIGLTLSDSLMMIPQKSVTAIVGLKK